MALFYFGRKVEGTKKNGSPFLTRYAGIGYLLLR